MGSKKINMILVIVSIILAAVFIGCLIYSLCNSRFSFVDTVSAMSSFFVAVLTIIYVYTTSKQMDFMKLQLEQMQQDQRLSEQPILDLVSTKFEIERPRFYYTPPEDEYSYQSRYLFFVRIHNVSNYSAMFVDISAQLLVEENERQLVLDTTSKRINVIAADSISEQINIVFAGDSKSKVMLALRSCSTSILPKLRITVYYKSLSGANYMLEHTYLLDIIQDNRELESVLKNWHTTLVAAPIEEKETLEILKRISAEKEWKKVFTLSKELFDKKLEGGSTLPIGMIEIPQKFSLRSISDDEFNSEIEHHQYGRYVGAHADGCQLAKDCETTTVRKR